VLWESPSSSEVGILVPEVKVTRTRVRVWYALMPIALISAQVALGQTGNAEHKLVHLWPGGGPGAVGNQGAFSTSAFKPVAHARGLTGTQKP
jgi:hypothetical protein